MVFQKKAGVKGKKQTPAKPKNKKAAQQSEDLEDLDMDFAENDSDGSESDEKVKSTDKTPKGKQLDKRVSFQIPSKNTPNKSDNFINKKPTPAKPTGLKEFGGMRAAFSPKNGKSKRPEEEEDDDDDDDDEDDDLDMLLGDSDDDDDDDDDEEEDDDEDDDDDDDEEEQSVKTRSSKSNLKKDASLVQKTPVKKTPAKTAEQSTKGLEKQAEKGKTPQKEAVKIPKHLTPGASANGDDDDDDDDDDDEDDDDEDDGEEQSKKSFKQQSPSKTPVKAVDTPAKRAEQSSKSVEKQVVKGKTPQKEAQQASAKNPKNLSSEMQKIVKYEAEQRRERDLKTLYIGNLPLDVAATEIKALSADILDVVLNKPRSKNQKTLFAFMHFATEAKADQNYKMLKNKKFRGEAIKIDFVGEKRQNLPSQQQLSSPDKKNLNLKKLYISSLPEDATIYQFAEFFPKAYQITLNTGYSQKYATVLFKDEKDAADAIEGCKDARLGNKPLTVLYSVGAVKKDKKRKKQRNKPQAAKKMKLEVSKQVSEEDDDDDDDDDDDEDD